MRQRRRSGAKLSLTRHDVCWGVGERLLRVSRTPAVPASAGRCGLTERIRAIHVASDGHYGSPNIHAELRDEGTRIGRKRVARLMRRAGIRGASRRRSFVVTTRRDPKRRPAPDLINRRFVAPARMSLRLVT